MGYGRRGRGDLGKEKERRAEEGEVRNVKDKDVNGKALKVKESEGEVSGKGKGR